MKKMNKKGFTLIEMLVVIAIIAVLVAIIIPVVSNSTTKAAAASDAANMRSYKAEIVTEYLQNGEGVSVPDGTGTVNVTVDDSVIALPTIKDIGSKEYTNDNISVTFNHATGEFKVLLAGNTIDQVAAVAESGDESSLAAVTPQGGGEGGGEG